MLAMKHKTLFAITLPLAVFALSLSSAAKTQIDLKDAQGKTVGTAIIWDHNPGGGVGIELNLHDLPPGEHALHFHQNAKCDPPDFKSAGPHFNPDGNLGDDSHSLFSNGGTAIVIHAKADDMKTDPAGNAGDRIACGVITK